MHACVCVCVCLCVCVCVQHTDVYADAASTLALEYYNTLQHILQHIVQHTALHHYRLLHLVCRQCSEPHTLQHTLRHAPQHILQHNITACCVSLAANAASNFSDSSPSGSRAEEIGLVFADFFNKYVHEELRSEMCICGRLSSTNTFMKQCALKCVSDGVLRRIWGGFG